MINWSFMNLLTPPTRWDPEGGQDAAIQAQTAASDRKERGREADQTLAENTRTRQGKEFADQRDYTETARQTALKETQDAEAKQAAATAALRAQMEDGGDPNTIAAQMAAHPGWVAHSAMEGPDGTTTPVPAATPDRQTPGGQKVAVGAGTPDRLLAGTTPDVVSGGSPVTQDLPPYETKVDKSVADAMKPTNADVPAPGGALGAYLAKLGAPAAQPAAGNAGDELSEAQRQQMIDPALRGRSTSGAPGDELTNTQHDQMVDPSLRGKTASPLVDESSRLPGMRVLSTVGAKPPEPIPVAGVPEADKPAIEAAAPPSAAKAQGDKHEIWYFTANGKVVARFDRTAIIAEGRRKAQGLAQGAEDITQPVMRQDITKGIQDILSSGGTTADIQSFIDKQVNEEKKLRQSGIDASFIAASKAQGQVGAGSNDAASRADAIEKNVGDRYHVADLIKSNELGDQVVKAAASDNPLAQLGSVQDGIKERLGRVSNFEFNKQLSGAGMLNKLGMEIMSWTGPGGLPADYLQKVQDFAKLNQQVAQQQLEIVTRIAEQSINKDPFLKADAQARKQFGATIRGRWLNQWNAPDMSGPMAGGIGNSTMSRATQALKGPPAAEANARAQALLAAREAERKKALKATP